MGLQGNESLQSLLEDEHPERLARAALLLSSDVQPGLNIDPYLQRLHRYAETVSERLAPYSRLGDVLFHLNDFLFNDCGFHTNTNYARSAELNYLHRVMDSRCGTPLSIAIIYLTIGRWLGLPLQGMLFPGRILVAYRDEDGEVVLDPADGGLSLQEKDLEMLLSHAFFFHRRPSQKLREHLAASDDRTILVRLLRQLKHAHLAQGDLESALRMLEQTMALVPGLASGFRERGQLYELLDCRYAAAMDYARYLELQPEAGDAAPLRERLPELLRTQVTLH